MFARLALRLAAVELLRGATIAGLNVFDSRQDEIDGLEAAEARPVLAVYTEDDRAKPYGTGRTQPNEVHVWLTIEAVIVSKGSFEVTLADGSVETVAGTGVPITDQRHEALVDVLDAQVRRRVLGQDLDAASMLFRKVAVGIEEIESVPARNAEKSARLAARTIRIKVKVPHDKAPVGAALPEPLASVAAGLTLVSSQAVIADLAGLLAAAQIAMPLVGIDLHAAAERTPASAIDAPVNGTVAIN